MDVSTWGEGRTEKFVDDAGDGSPRGREVGVGADSLGGIFNRRLILPFFLPPIFPVKQLGRSCTWGTERGLWLRSNRQPVVTDQGKGAMDLPGTRIGGIDA